MPSAPNKPRNDFVVCREHIYDRGRKTGNPSSRSCILRLGPATPMVTLLVWTFSLRMSSASAIFPARPSANQRRPCSRSVHYQPVQSCPFPFANVSTGLKVRITTQTASDAVLTSRRHSPGLPQGLLTARQFLPGTAAPHAGRLFRHDVRPGTRGLVADLDQDPAPLAGPGQREASG